MLHPCFYLACKDLLLGKIWFSIIKDVAERNIPSDAAQMDF